MIHHVSIAVRDPEHVATVLAELFGGYAGRFLGPFPGAWAVYQEDDHGTSIEVYANGTTIVRGEGDAPGTASVQAPAPGAFHALISINATRATIEQIGAREGWRTRHFWRGPPGVQLFELYEMWIENHVLLELVTPDMLPAYVKISNGPAQRALLARRASGSP